MALIQMLLKLYPYVYVLRRGEKFFHFIKSGRGSTPRQKKLKKLFSFRFTV